MIASKLLTWHSWNCNPHLNNFWTFHPSINTERMGILILNLFDQSAWDPYFFKSHFSKYWLVVFGVQILYKIFCQLFHAFDCSCCTYIHLTFFQLFVVGTWKFNWISVLWSFACNLDKFIHFRNIMEITHDCLIHDYII